MVSFSYLKFLELLSDHPAQAVYLVPKASIVTGPITAEKVVAQGVTLSNKSFDIRVVRVVALVLRFSETNHIFSTLLFVVLP